MTHGAPDWGVFAAKKTVYSLQDMAELAARLGSIVTFDRRGDVVWLDDFEDNINKWRQLISGAGSIALSTEAALSGGKSAKLVTGAVVGNYSLIAQGIATAYFTKNGFEAAWVSPSTAGYLIDFCLYGQISDVEYDAIIRYRKNEQTLSLFNEDGNEQIFATSIPVFENIWDWGKIKIVADLVAGKYVRVIFNNLTYDVSTYNLWTWANPGVSHIGMGISLEVVAAGSKTAYIDNAILTINEP